MSIVDYTKGPKSVEVHNKGVHGVKHCKELFSRQGYKTSEVDYRADFLLMLSEHKSKKYGFRFAWCEVVRTHNS